MQSPNVWPESVISLCSWHAERAVLKYLQTNNQSPWAAGHAIIDYRDTDRERGWDDAYELDTAWVQERNLEREALFRTEVSQRHKDTTDESVLQEKLLEAGKRKKHCIIDKELCKDITSLFLTHLRWHPFTHLPIFTEVDMSRIDIRAIWREQMTEMHEMCKRLGESWAWEYLWNHWYRPQRWKIWARAVCREVPIINSNAIVESLWSTLKKRYLRKHSRAKLEFLIDIIMNQYLPNLTMLITAHRKGEKRPVWYLLIYPPTYYRYNLFVKEWKKKCAMAKENFQYCEDKDRFYEEQWHNYGTTIENWWCGCPSYQTSANHVCKHLIAIYIGREGLDSNKPPMPFYGDVWRQTVSPPLWIAGLHDFGRLTVHDLQPVPEQNLPILAQDHLRIDIPDDNIDDDGLEIEPALYDSDDDDDDDDDDEPEEDRREDIQKVVGEDNSNEANRGAEDGDWEDIGGFGDVIFDEDDFEDEETAAERIERELRGDDIKEEADLLARQLLRVVEELKQVKTYPSGHRYLLELPRMRMNNIPAWHRHVERRDAVKSARVMPSMFARVRTGNMFAN